MNTRSLVERTQMPRKFHGSQGRLARATVLLMVLVIWTVTAAPALAHNPFTSLDVRYPGFTGTYWSFRSTHYATGCVNGGDPTPCSNGFDFKVHSGAQIKILGDWSALGQVVKSVLRHWPTSTAVSATFYVDCPSGHPTYTMRTRGKGGIVHNGSWYWTAFFFSGGRTETC